MTDTASGGRNPPRRPDKFEQLHFGRHMAMPELGRDWRTDIALRPQPARQGPDFWPTICPALRRASVDHALPLLSGPIWECAAGDGHLVREFVAAGYEAYGSDLYPQDGTEPIDFLTDIPPLTGAAVVTNPPSRLADEFITRGLELFDQRIITGLCLLLRHDFLQAGGRCDVLNRATLEIRCCWRARWIEGSTGGPRWSFSWIVWAGGPRRPPVYLRERRR
jgi:hypothetical protein